MIVLDHLKVVSALCGVWPQEPKSIVVIWISRPKQPTVLYQDGYCSARSG